MSGSRLTLFLLPPILSLSCIPPAPAPTTAPLLATEPVSSSFANYKSGIAFKYPSGWHEQSKDPTQFRFASDKGKSIEPSMELVLDVPKLPWWVVPQMVNADGVRGGYVDDVKKRMPSAHASNLPDPPVQGATTHRVILLGQIDNKPVVNDAVMIVRNSKVYILSIEVDPAIYPRAKRVLEETVATLTWIKS